MMTLALFGEAEKGSFRKSYFCQTLDDLALKLGNPPEDSAGLFCAVQALLYSYPILFYRVEEEGASFSDYLWGLEHLQDKEAKIGAIALPGLGDVSIYDRAVAVANKVKVPLLMREKDLYDYLMDR